MPLRQARTPSTSSDRWQQQWAETFQQVKNMTNRPSFEVVLHQPAAGASGATAEQAGSGLQCFGNIALLIAEVLAQGG